MTSEVRKKNFQGADLRGKNLAGEDFSYADIRGANFSNTVLIGANFCNTKAGLPVIWVISLVAFSLILSLLAGLISAYAGAFIGELLSNNIYNSSFFGVFSLIISAIFLRIILYQGFGATLATLAGIVAACLIAALAFFPNAQKDLLYGTVLTALALAGVNAGVGNMAVAMAIARVISLPRSKACTAFMAVMGAVLGAMLGTSSHENVFFIAGFVALTVIAFGLHVGSQATDGDKRYWLINSVAINIVAQRGTKFGGANLTDADFTQASLKCVDFRKATLTRTCWFGVKKLNQARVEGTYLEDIRVRQLVITKDGQGQNFDCLNLRELNLKDANLQSASFISTDLSTATLHNANLLSAKLAQAQLYQAKLTEALLTGAFIENWGISTDTQLEGIKCDYIYMRLPTKDNPDPWRKPDNRQEIFKEGDFSDFIAPMIKTIELYQKQNVDPRQVGSKFKTLDLFHYEGIDPNAAAIAVTQLAEEHPEAELEIVALEGRGQKKVRLQAVVADDTNSSDLSNKYFEKYTEIKSLPYSDLQEVLLGIKEKDERIRSLEKLLENAIQQPKFYVETYQTQGEFVISQSQGSITLSSTQNDISDTSTNTNVSGGQVYGGLQTAIGSDNQLAQETYITTPIDEKLLTSAEVVLLLGLIEQLVGNAELSQATKEEALTYLSAAKKAAGREQPNKELVKVNMKGMAETLETASKTMEVAKNLLENIKPILIQLPSWLGVAKNYFGF